MNLEYTGDQINQVRAGPRALRAPLAPAHAKPPQTVHAEQCLVANVLEADGEELERIVGAQRPHTLSSLCTPSHAPDARRPVSAPPCGHCRQFLNELPWAAVSVVDVPSHGMELRLRDILPYRWGLLPPPGGGERLTPLSPGAPASDPATWAAPTRWDSTAAWIGSW